MGRDYVYTYNASLNKYNEKETNERMRIQTDIQMMAMKLGVQDKINTDLSEAKRDVADTAATAKVASSAIDHHAKVASTHLAGLHDQEKQRISNEKPIATPKK